MDGILIVDKTPGVTSRDVDNRAKRILDSKGVGHLGTLDPFATGVLVLGVGQGTKLFPFMEDLPKTYRARLELGESRDTGERTGAVTGKASVPALYRDLIDQVLKSFLGEITQVPPAYSAKHVDGKRAYEIAREGKAVELKPQTVRIESIQLLNLSDTWIEFEARVSRGTYIRTLGEDIAKALGTLGYLSSLRRTAVGPYLAEDGVTPELIDASRIIPMSEALPFVPKVYLSSFQERIADSGGRLFLSGRTEERIQAIRSDGTLAGIYGREREGQYRCLRGFKR